MKKVKKYDIVYRERRNKESPLQFKVMEGYNIDCIKRKFWEEIQTYDIYANPKLTLVNICCRKR